MNALATITAAPLSGLSVGELVSQHRDAVAERDRLWAGDEALDPYGDASAAADALAQAIADELTVRLQVAVGSVPIRQVLEIVS